MLNPLLLKAGLAVMAIVLPYYTAIASDFTLEPGFEAVTCGSTIRLVHRATRYQLHSQEAKYGQGQGSGQQIVTALETESDQDCFWLVKPALDATCTRGQPVQCGQTIRLMHYMTGKHLHSHTFTSPLSGQQEVSGFADNDVGDHWQVECASDLPDGKLLLAKVDDNDVWTRELPVYLRHVDTSTYLSASSDYIYGSPIRGQMEVSAVGDQNTNTLWQTENGVYFGIVKNTTTTDNEDKKTQTFDDDHDEL
ncbi:MIR motif-containing protein [Syncephalis fuscata]|nr:MIR motif-containing protein [Syncephalis fuscata]